MLNQNRPHTTVYLLRCWAEPSGQEDQLSSWRFRLEDPRAEKTVHFLSIDQLVSFLKERFDLPTSVASDLDRPNEIGRLDAVEINQPESGSEWLNTFPSINERDHLRNKRIYRLDNHKKETNNGK